MSMKKHFFFFVFLFSKLISPIAFIGVFKLCILKWYHLQYAKWWEPEKIVQKLDFWSLFDPKMCLRSEVRAVLTFLAGPWVSFVMIYIRNTYSILLLETGSQNLVLK